MGELVKLGQLNYGNFLLWANSSIDNKDITDAWKVQGKPELKLVKNCTRGTSPVDS